MTTKQKPIDIEAVRMAHALAESSWVAVQLRDPGVQRALLDECAALDIKNDALAAEVERLRSEVALIRSQHHVTIETVRSVVRNALEDGGVIDTYDLAEYLSHRALLIKGGARKDKVGHDVGG